MRNEVAILVASFDGYSDVWDPFFKFFFEFWPGCPYPVYLGTNTLEYSHPRVNVIKVGADKDYSSNLLMMLSKIEQEWVLFTVEDIFLSAKVDTLQLSILIKKAQKKNASHVQLLYKPLNYINLLVSKNKISEDYFELPRGIPYRAVLNLALWKKEALSDLLVPGESAWDFEYYGTDRSFSKGDRYLAVTKKNKDLFVFVHGIIKKEWAWRATKYLHKNGIVISHNARKRQVFYLDAYQRLYELIRFIIFSLLFILTGEKWFMYVQNKWNRHKRD